MPIPATHKARSLVAYHADDGNQYSIKIPTKWLNDGPALGMALLQTADLANYPPLPANWRPRHLAIETTNGEDSDGNYHVYRRKIPFAIADVDATGAHPLAINETFTFEGCDWVVKGRVGEKHFAR